MEVLKMRKAMNLLKFVINYFVVFDSETTRANALALIPDEIAKEIIKGVPESSVVMQVATRAANLSRKQRRMPVLSSLPNAYFVSGDTGLKQTSKGIWENKYLIAEEIAVIIPIAEAVLDDAEYDIFSELKPRIIEAIGVAFDAAVLYGTNKPASWPDDLKTLATAAGNAVTFGTGVDLYDDLLGESGVISAVEEDGFMANGHIALMSMRGKYRSLRDSNGQPLFKMNMQDSTKYALDGAKCLFPKNGAMDSTVLQFSGDFSQVIYAIRQDITYKVLTEAVITDAAGNIIFNLAQQDMVALRVVFRVAYQVPNPINRLVETEADRFPIAILLPA